MSHNCFQLLIGVVIGAAIGCIIGLAHTIGKTTELAERLRHGDPTGALRLANLIIINVRKYIKAARAAIRSN